MTLLQSGQKDIRKYISLRVYIEFIELESRISIVQDGLHMNLKVCPMNQLQFKYNFNDCLVLSTMIHVL